MTPAGSSPSVALAQVMVEGMVPPHMRTLEEVAQLTGAPLSTVYGICRRYLRDLKGEL
jgi:hypothetical protein